MSRGVVFDVDDTLYLERDYVRSGFQAVAGLVERLLAVSGFFETAWGLFEGGHRGRVFNDALARLDVDAEAIDVADLVEAYRSHEPEIDLLDDSRARLEVLAQKDIPVGVITDGPAASQHAKVDALGLRCHAAIVLVTADLGPGKGKPHEAAFRRVETALHLSGDQLVYVADNPAKDFIAPRRLGWRTLRVRRPGSLHEDIASGTDVDHEVRDLGEVDLL